MRRLSLVCVCLLVCLGPAALSHADDPPTPAQILAILQDHAQAARAAHASTNIDSDSPHHADDAQTDQWHANEAAVAKLRTKLHEEWTDDDGNFRTPQDQASYWHWFAVGIADAIDKKKSKGRASGNCIHIAAAMYADFYNKFGSGSAAGKPKPRGDGDKIEIAIFSKKVLTRFGLHAFLVVKYRGNYYIVDGWKGDGEAFGPLRWDGDNEQFVDPTTGEAPDPLYDSGMEMLAGWTTCTGSQGFQ